MVLCYDTMLVLSMFTGVLVEHAPFIFSTGDGISSERSAKKYQTIQMMEDVLVKLTLRRLMLYIYMEHPFLMFLDHTQRRSTVGRTPLDE